MKIMKSGALTAFAALALMASHEVHAIPRGETLKGGALGAIRRPQIRSALAKHKMPKGKVETLISKILAFVKTHPVKSSTLGALGLGLLGAAGYAVYGKMYGKAKEEGDAPKKQDSPDSSHGSELCARQQNQDMLLFSEDLRFNDGQVERGQVEQETQEIKKKKQEEKSRKRQEKIERKRQEKMLREEEEERQEKILREKNRKVDSIIENINTITKNSKTEVRKKIYILKENIKRLKGGEGKSKSSRISEQVEKIGRRLIDGRFPADFNDIIYFVKIFKGVVLQEENKELTEKLISSALYSLNEISDSKDDSKERNLKKLADAMQYLSCAIHQGGEDFAEAQFLMKFLACLWKMQLNVVLKDMANKMKENDRAGNIESLKDFIKNLEYRGIEDLFPEIRVVEISLLKAIAADIKPIVGDGVRVSTVIQNLDKYIAGDRVIKDNILKIAKEIEDTRLRNDTENLVKAI